MQAYAKKALLRSAFFIACVLPILFVNVAFAGKCSVSKLSPPEKAIVKWVYDGDTLLLTDKRKIRIIGVDTPEVRHHQQKAQAYGAKAREALRVLLKKHHYRVVLRYGPERFDRYKRVLAHVYLPDGMDISRWLLKKGYARTMAFPPNIKLAKCYKKDEEKAQLQLLRIWRYKFNQIRTLKDLPKKYSGYVRLEATIKSIKHHKKSIVIKLKGHKKRPIRLKIQKKNLKYFKKLNFDKLWNKTIHVTGILKNRHGTRTIYVNYPTQLNVVKIKSNQSTIRQSTKEISGSIKWSLKK